MRIAHELHDAAGQLLGVEAVGHDAGLAVVDEIAHTADGNRHHRTARHLRFDQDAGESFGVARQDEDVDRGEDLRDVAAVAEHVHEGAEPARDDVELESVS